MTTEPTVTPTTALATDVAYGNPDGDPWRDPWLDSEYAMCLRKPHIRLTEQASRALPRTQLARLEAANVVHVSATGIVVRLDKQRVFFPWSSVLSLSEPDLTDE